MKIVIINLLFVLLLLLCKSNTILAEDDDDYIPHGKFCEFGTDLQIQAKPKYRCDLTKDEICLGPYKRACGSEYGYYEINGECESRDDQSCKINAGLFCDRDPDSRFKWKCQCVDSSMAWNPEKKSCCRSHMMDVCPYFERLQEKQRLKNCQMFQNCTKDSASGSSEEQDEDQKNNNSSDILKGTSYMFTLYLSAFIVTVFCLLQ